MGFTLNISILELELIGLNAFSEKKNMHKLMLVAIAIAVISSSGLVDGEFIYVKSAMDFYLEFVFFCACIFVLLLHGNYVYSWPVPPKKIFRIPTT